MIVMKKEETNLLQDENALAPYQEYKTSLGRYLYGVSGFFTVMLFSVSSTLSILGSVFLSSLHLSAAPFFVGVVAIAIGSASAVSYGFSRGFLKTKKQCEWMLYASALLRANSRITITDTIRYSLDADNLITLRSSYSQDDEYRVQYCFSHHGNALMSGFIGQSIRACTFDVASDILDQARQDQIGVIILGLLTDEINKTKAARAEYKNSANKSLDIFAQKADVSGNHPVEMLDKLISNLFEIEVYFNHNDLSFVTQSFCDGRDYFTKADGVSAPLSGLLDYIIPKAIQLCSYIEEDGGLGNHWSFRAGLVDIAKALNREIESETSAKSGDALENTKQISQVLKAIA